MINLFSKIMFAALDIDFKDPVPVPTNDDFGCTYLGKVLIGCSPAGATTFTQLMFGIIDILLAVTGTIAVLFVIIAGIRYVTAHGNEEQAEGAKKTLLHAIIGIVLVILSFAVINVIANALT